MQQSSPTGPSGRERIEVRPLTAERWEDLVALFGPAGAQEGCWDMFWRVRSKEYTAHRKRNRAALRKLAKQGVFVGLLAYRNGQAGFREVARPSGTTRAILRYELKRQA